MFLRAQSYEKLSQSNEARQVYAQLAARPNRTPGRASAVRRSRSRRATPAGALEASNQASPAMAPCPRRIFSRGWRSARTQDLAGAAVAFQKASDLDPNWAYAHYNAGLAYRR